MKPITLPAFAAAIALALCPAAFAAKSGSEGHGETSGPAAGKPTTSNTVIPKQSGATTGAASTTGAGAPGAAGKPGTEAGGAAGGGGGHR